MVSQGEHVVRAENIVKIYPDGTIALRGVSLGIRPGEVLGLLGENGAGKTTLVKILAGILKPTEGRIFVGGQEVRLRSSKHALDLGLGLVQQFFTLVDNMTVLENIVLGKEETGLLSPIELRLHRRRVEKLVEKTGLRVPLDAEVGLLPVGLKQRVEILKTLYKGVRVLMLDEPTTFLTPHEVSELFGFLRTLVRQGIAVVFISHKIKEVLRVTDRIVVMRRGRIVGELETAKATPEELARLMVGAEITPATRKAEPVAAQRREPVLSVRGLRVLNDLGVEAVKGVSFDLYPGEIMGIAGVEGNGQEELVEAIVGLRRPLEGKVYVNGSEVSHDGTVHAYSLGVSYIPGDRDRYGLVLGLSIAENSVLTRHWERSFKGPLGTMRWKIVTNVARMIVEKFNVVAPSIRVPVRVLSGGNRQRLLVGRELLRNCNVIIATHPTRGLDVASTEYIRSLLLQARNEGKGVLLVSADLDEVIQLSDRLGVMYEGRLLALKGTEEYTLEEIGLLMGGVVRR